MFLVITKEGKCAHCDQSAACKVYDTPLCRAHLDVLLSEAQNMSSLLRFIPWREGEIPPSQDPKRNG